MSDVEFLSQIWKIEKAEKALEDAMVKLDEMNDRIEPLKTEIEGLKKNNKELIDEIRQMAKKA